LDEILASIPGMGAIFHHQYYETGCRTAGGLLELDVSSGSGDVTGNPKEEGLWRWLQSDR
jgi:hypothetical protein